MEPLHCQALPDCTWLEGGSQLPHSDRCHASSQRGRSLHLLPHWPCWMLALCHRHLATSSWMTMLCSMHYCNCNTQCLILTLLLLLLRLKCPRWWSECALMDADASSASLLNHGSYASDCYATASLRCVHPSAVCVCVSMYTCVCEIDSLQIHQSMALHSPYQNQMLLPSILTKAPFVRLVLKFMLMLTISYIWHNIWRCLVKLSDNVATPWA